MLNPYLQLLFMISLALAVVTRAQPSHARTPRLIAQEAQTFFTKRSSNSIGDIANPQNITHALELFKELANYPGYEKQANLGVLKSLCFLGSHAFGAQKHKSTYFHQGMKLAKKLTEKYPQEASFFYWRAVFLSLWAREEGIFRSIREGIAYKIKANAERSLSLDSNFKKGACYLLLGALLHVVPQIPLISPWASSQKSIKLLEKSLKLNPDDLNNYYLLALVQSDLGNYPAALQLLTTIEERTIRPNWQLEDRRSKWRAQLLKDELLTNK